MGYSPHSRQDGVPPPPGQQEDFLVLKFELYIGKCIHTGNFKGVHTQHPPKGWVDASWSGLDSERRVVNGQPITEC